VRGANSKPVIAPIAEPTNKPPINNPERLFDIFITYLHKSILGASADIILKVDRAAPTASAPNPAILKVAELALIALLIVGISPAIRTHLAVCEQKKQAIDSVRDCNSDRVLQFSFQTIRSLAGTVELSQLHKNRTEILID
jgi:hypothetical protein